MMLMGFGLTAKTRHFSENIDFIYASKGLCEHLTHTFTFAQLYKWNDNPFAMIGFTTKLMDVQQKVWFVR